MLNSSDAQEEETYNGRMSDILGLIQLTGGILAILFQSILTGIFSVAMYIGAGFWGGIVVSSVTL